MFNSTVFSTVVVWLHYGFGGNRVIVERYSASEDLNDLLVARVESDVTSAFSNVVTVGDQFIVNDTLWFWLNPSDEVRPTVVNSAKYISGGFQRALETRFDWRIEETIDNQTIDAYKEFQLPVRRYSITKQRLSELVAELVHQSDGEFGETVLKLTNRYFRSASYSLPTELEAYRAYFEITESLTEIRVGLEFETGNIASSFRAINKLQGLYDSGHIDVGVFITSKSKADGAARIWPISNRNGSFEELTNRNYSSQRSYPHIDISFRPDGYSSDAPYFSKDGCYDLSISDERLRLAGRDYASAYAPNGAKKLLPL